MIDPVDLPDLSLKFNAARAGFVSGCYYQASPASGLSTSATLGNGTLRVMQMPVPDAVTLSKIGAEITVVGDVGSTLRLGIYADNGHGYPGALVLDAGTIPADVVAVSEIAVSKKLTPGMYWVGAVVQGAATTQPTVRTAAVPTFGVFPLTSGTTPTANQALANYVFVGFNVSGALLTTFPTSVNLSSACPRVFFKVA